MTDTEIRIAIAEKCGWKREIYESEILKTRCTKWIRPSVDGMVYEQFRPPDYPSDLNAMHEAEKMLGRLKKAAYGQELGCIAARIKGNHDEFDTFKLAHATARQRAEAFLRTFGLWKGGK